MTAITDLIATTLATAKRVDTQAVDFALSAARPALLLLVSSRHLKTVPVVLVAGQAVCEILCRYDEDAIDGEENLQAVSGVSAANSFTLHLPTPDQLGTTIETVAASNQHLTTDPAPDHAPKATLSASAPLVNADALRGLR
ncbi:hypothetical protein GCM10023153_31420 [Ornithinibacter aureus]|uniref:Uncharacterized protein n=1 Tax=Ornithinibacter aureus TaxID=622664 RepID=A0ABP8K8I6_9MICO